MHTFSSKKSTKSSLLSKKILVLITLFIFSVGLRLWNLNTAGRTWDEHAYVNTGHKFIELLSKGNFTDPLWYQLPDHPPIAKYLYGVASFFDAVGKEPSGQTIFNFDWTYSRLVAVIFSSLTVVLVLLLGWKYFSPSVGIIASLIFSTMPILLGLSQLVTIEGVLIFFFTFSVYLFLSVLENATKKKIVITGIILGLTFGIKYTNLKLVPLYFFIFFVFIFTHKKQDISKLLRCTVAIFIIAMGTFFLSWPALWYHAPETLRNIIASRFQTNKPPVELFMGKRIAVPYWYFLIYFLITTPFSYLLFFLIGLKKIYKNKNWIIFVLFAWFFIPFGQSFLYLKQNGIRYIIEIYVPFSILAAVGFNSIIKRYSKKEIHIVAASIPFLLYMNIIIYALSPYYLDYFNILVGGTSGVYQSKTFAYGWWGEGQREAGIYLVENARANSSVGLQVQPKFVFPPIDGLQFYLYDEKKEYNYVVVSKFYLLNNPFNMKKLESRYFLVYTVQADGAPLVTVYQHK